jgi:hypothetical protein
VTSPEYLAAHGGNYVHDLYVALLGREPAATETAWQNLLAAGASPGQVAEGIASSPEALRRNVAGYYTALLGRAPDAAGAAA